MSRKRNRNIKSIETKFEPWRTKQNERKVDLDYFGETVKDRYSPPFYKPDFDVGFRDDTSEAIPNRWNRKSNVSNTYSDNIDNSSLISRFNEISLTRSTSSSPSWSDENDGDSSNKIQFELERMDRVLRGIEPIPLQYDVEEYKEWMETFPSLNLFGNESKGPYNMWSLNGESSPSSSRFFHKTSSHNLKAYKEEIKKAVIKNIYENISIRLTGSVSDPMENTKTKQFSLSSARSSINKTQAYLKNCLKVSPFPQTIPEVCETKPFISKTYEATSFKSLPSMTKDQNKNISAQSSNWYLNSNSKHLKHRRSSKDIILPPIKSGVKNQLRSISATPIYPTLLSSKSIRLENKLQSGDRKSVV